LHITRRVGGAPGAWKHASRSKKYSFARASYSIGNKLAEAGATKTMRAVATPSKGVFLERVTA
jgi:hypothetical protein